MRILLTGATGFVGKYVYDSFKSCHEMFVIGRNDMQNTQTIRWDFNEKMPTQILPEKIDVIIHLAQSKLYREFPENGLDMFSVNVQSTAALLDFASKTGVKQFILMSTGSVYEPYPSVCSEDVFINPSSGYACSKYASEILAKAYAEKIKICVLRLFFPYGPGQVNRLIPDLIYKVQNNIPILLSGNEGLSISSIFVTDVLELLKASIKNQWEGTFNVSSLEVCSIKTIGEMIGGYLNKKVNFEKKIEDKELIIQADIRKLLNLVPWMRFTPLEEGLFKMVNL
jgi:nucleoside-diphosphate-sugar epimerase